MPFCLVNQLLRWGEDNRLERVLWIDLAGNALFAIDIASKTALPRILDYSHLALAESEGRVTVEPNDPTVRCLPEDSLPLKQRELRDEAWASSAH
jgi:hypothetical protein